MYNRKDQSSEDTVVAYTMFRFEPGYEDEASLYWCVSPHLTHLIRLTLRHPSYELQVHVRYRGLGIGRFLVDKLTIIGKHWHMEKILLTVLKGWWALLGKGPVSHCDSEYCCSGSLWKTRVRLHLTSEMALWLRVVFSRH